MKLTLICPPTIVQNPNVRYLQAPPLGPCYLAAVVREAGHDVAVIDSVGEALDRIQPFKPGLYLNGLAVDEIIDRIDPDTDLVGVSVMFSNLWPIARRVIEAVRQK
jgi:hypothetical protein